MPPSRFAGPDPRGPKRRRCRTARRFCQVWMTVAIVFLFLVSIPSPGTQRPESGFPSSDRFVTFRTDATVDEIGSAGARLLEDYGGFSVARGTERSALLLERQGRYVGVLPDASTLELARGPVNLRALSATSNSGWTIDAGRGTTVGVVHFYAPIKP